jgi:hypothetical protein
LWLLFALGSAPQAFGVGNLDIGDLNKDEVDQYLQCKRAYFLNASCEQLLRRICQKPTNQDDWDCVASDFEQCSHVDYASASCESLLDRICKLTGDQYSDACDRYHYEVCLRKDFKTEGCPETRLRFSLPMMATQVEAAADAAAKDPNVFPQVLAYKCALGGADASNPLHAACNPTAPPPVLGMGDYQAAFDEIDPRAPDYAAQRLAVLQALLRAPRSENMFDQAEATNVWLREEDESNGLDDGANRAARAAGMQVLAALGDDGVVTTFLLVQGAADGDEGVRVAALRGLGARRYPSGLAMLALTRGLRAEAAAERTAAMSGLAARWQADLQSGYVGRLDAKKLGSLMDCRNVVPDAAVYDRIRTMADTDTVDFTDPKILCGIGQGARLFQLKHEIWGDFTRAARQLDAVAVHGLGILAVGDAQTVKEALAVARDVLAAASPAPARRAALFTLDKLTPKNDHLAVKAVYAAMAQELQDELAARPVDEDGLGGLLELMRNAGFLGGLDDSGAVSLNNAVPLVRDLCLAPDATPATLRALCFAAVASAFDHSAEEAFWPHLVAYVHGQNYAERDVALQVLESSLFNFIDENRHTTFCSRHEDMAREVRDEVRAMLRQHVGAAAPLFTRYWKQAKSLTTGSPELHACTRLPDIWDELVTGARQPEVFDWLSASLAANYPTLPMKAWYDAFKDTHADVIERVDAPAHAGDPTHGYRPRKDEADYMVETFKRRSPPDVVLRGDAWPGLQEVWQAAAAAPDMKLNFWGVTAPKSPTRSHR